MMAVVFAGLSGAFLLGWLDRRRPALILIAITLLLAIHLFLWEIYSPEYGFRMPWLDT